ncbi:glycosyl transferase [Fibrobacteria bacterium R8-3-H12]
MRKIMKYIKNPWLIFLYLEWKGFLNWLPDSLYFKGFFRAKCGYPLDLKNPKTFNEKLQWIKLHGNLEKYTDLVDKYEVRKYIAQTIGEEYLIPLIGVWDRVEDIDFGKLPEQFVLKCNHDSGSVVICKDKNNFDIEKAKNKLKKHLKRNYYYHAREAQYKNIKPRVICEKYMVDKQKIEPEDYRIFSFNGTPKIIFVDRSILKKKSNIRNLYDVEWNYIPVSVGYPTDCNRIISKPNKLEEMLKLTKILSKNIPCVRVDFYLIDDKIYFGELTFTHAAGYQKFEPKEFGFEMGSWLELPK